MSTSYGAATDTGRHRGHNEDHCFIDADSGLFIVADGMGGHQGGEVASALAAQTIADAIRSGFTLVESISSAHKAILDAAEKKQGIAGMGTTVVALRLDGCEYEIAWVGDSRAYLYDGGLKQLTRDHSFVQQMVDAGALTKEEARMHPDAGVLSQALGASGITDVDVGVVTGRLFAGQKVVLCSDGLTSELDDDTISAILEQGGSEQEVVDRLIQGANDHGGEDNITVVVASAPPEAKVKKPRKSTRPLNARELNRFLANGKEPRFGRKIQPTIFIPLLFLMLVLAAGIFFYLTRPDPQPHPDSGFSEDVLPEQTENDFYPKDDFPPDQLLERREFERLPRDERQYRQFAPHQEKGD